MSRSSCRLGSVSRCSPSWIDETKLNSSMSTAVPPTVIAVRTLCPRRFFRR
jgi:hypothetical protein